jgi:hypothetical protein
MLQIQLGASRHGFLCGARSTWLRPRSCVSPHKSRGPYTWYQLLHQENPEPMLCWFWSRNPELPGDLLTLQDPHLDVAADLLDLYRQTGIDSLSLLAQELIQSQVFFKPISVHKYETILQFTTKDAQLFQGCWKRLRSTLDVAADLLDLYRQTGIDSLSLLAQELIQSQVLIGSPKTSSNLSRYTNTRRYYNLLPRMPSCSRAAGNIKLRFFDLAAIR